MKRIILFLIALITPLITAAPVGAASANNFYFKSAEFDYYLKPTETGSRLKVKEVLTVVFPETNQNHGITRAIPYTNQGGANLTAESLSALNLTVKRNGLTEPISKTETENNSYIFYIGSSSAYVHGEQVYELNYGFKNVITEFDAAGNLTYNGKDATLQELYWDTNGTGWSQRFESLTARLHLPAAIAKNLSTGTSCYVGYYGKNNSSRCTISADDETTDNTSAANAEKSSAAETIITFETKNLAAGENLTFAVDFAPSTFAVPEPSKSYLAMFLSIAEAALCLALLVLLILLSRRAVKTKHALLKSTFVKPEYQPPKGLTVAESAEVGIKINTNSQVATLLELAVNNKIAIKHDKTGILKNKDAWQIEVKSLEGLTTAEEDVLSILNGGYLPAVGETFTVKKHRASAKLESLSRDYGKSTVRRLKDAGLMTGKTPGYLWLIPGGTLTLVMIFSSMAFTALSERSATTFGGYAFPVTGLFIGIVCFITSSIIATKAIRLSSRTEEGIKMSVYLDGLKLYIKMAEADRIQFLQSVKGADTSTEGIVKLYEKFLPYAVIFGEEKSWMSTLNKYYEQAKNYDHGWYSGDDILTYALLSDMMTTTRSTISSSTSYSSSSSSSGGGGGGFSGGGGGGGGGGGW